MKKFFLFLFSVVIFVFCGFLTGCTSEINISLTKDGVVEVGFNGTSGVAFATLIRSVNGVEEGDVAFDTDEITKELSKNNFTDVKAVSKKGTDLSITMKDKEKKSPLFTANVLSIKDSSISAVLSADRLLAFYQASDDEIVTFLDMLLAPVFNDEVLSVDEYIETIASFYGDDAANEIKESDFKITLTDANNNSNVFTIPMTKLLTLDETLKM